MDKHPIQLLQLLESGPLQFMHDQAGPKRVLEHQPDSIGPELNFMQLRKVPPGLWLEWIFFQLARQSSGEDVVCKGHVRTEKRSRRFVIRFCFGTRIS